MRLEENSGQPSLVKGEGDFCYTEVLLAGSPDKEPSESYLPSPATHREGGEAWPLSDKEPADPVAGRGRRVADSCPDMRVVQGL